MSDKIFMEGRIAHLEMTVKAQASLIRQHEALIDHVLSRSLFKVLGALPQSLLPLAEEARRRVIDKDSPAQRESKP